MKITEVKLLVLEGQEHDGRVHKITRVENLRRIQYTHTSAPTGKKAKVTQKFIEVQTDEGISGRCTTDMSPHDMEVLRAQAVGEDPLCREAMYQRLHKGTRWVYLKPGWFGDFDNCLWDIAGKAAGLPVHALIGRVRDRFPCYLTGGDMDLDGYFRHIEQGKEIGINAYKFHTYKGGKADIPIFRAVREELGPDFLLLNDPVCSYDLREAIEVGHAMEELDFIWLEEPFHEQKMDSYQELCRELTMPVMGTEMLMHDIGISTQWLMHGATDLLRGNARNGTTAILKMAHFAEMYDTSIELNGHGGLFGHLHATLGCCIDNTSFYEYFQPGSDGQRKQGQTWGMTNAPLIEDGHLAPNDLPGWGAEWDEEKFQSLIGAEH
jgi:L-alanine-DL-glutamate epimerase-like enolase superfamily enzyme